MSKTSNVDLAHASITKYQVTAARQLLGWERADLALAAGLSVFAVRYLETGEHGTRAATADAIKSAFERAAVRFPSTTLTEYNGNQVQTPPQMTRAATLALASLIKAALGQDDADRGRAAANFLLAWRSSQEYGGLDLKSAVGADTSLREAMKALFSFIVESGASPEGYGIEPELDAIAHRWRALQASAPADRPALPGPAPCSAPAAANI